MNILIKREIFTEKSTIGSLFIDGVFECYALEDVVRPEGEKVPGQTAIPYGEYEVVIDESTRFGRKMPHILNVPMFQGIRIHAGNTDKDTEGCILLGRSRSLNFVGNSREAFVAFYHKLESGLSRGTVNLDIIGKKA